MISVEDVCRVERRDSVIASSTKTAGKHLSSWKELDSTLQSRNQLQTNSTMATAPTGPFELPPLPYDREALAPHISAETIDYHYGKHHRGYVTRLNTLVQGHEYAKLSLEEIVKTVKEPKFFNPAAQVNYCIF